MRVPCRSCANRAAIREVGPVRGEAIASVTPPRPPEDQRQWQIEPKRELRVRQDEVAQGMLVRCICHPYLAGDELRGLCLAGALEIEQRESQRARKRRLAVAGGTGECDPR